MKFFRKPSRQRRSLRSYAQSGEDILAHSVLCRTMRIAKPTYVDIGAHDPVFLSNTYLLYRLGCRGLLLEPDPDCVCRLRRKRPQDRILPIGISAGKAGQATFYRLNQPTLNTFSLEDAQDACRQGPYRIVQELTVPVLPVSQAIEQGLTGRPNFLSIDAEGMDLDILRGFDFDRHGPELICIEAAEFCENNAGAMRREVFELMQDRGYFLYASTYLNAMFVSRKHWLDRVGDPPAVTLQPHPNNNTRPLTSAA